ncbi:MAG: GDP-mannose 4,6-dehydratase, partial [Flavitalea sp.]
VTIVRPFNTFGPRQSARAVIPTIITQLLSGCSSIKLGDTSPTRDLLYVRDTVAGFVEIAKSESLIGHDVNISTNTEISIGDVADKIISILNSSAMIVTDEVRIRPKQSEVFRLLGDNKKILQHTDWKIKYSLDKALSETIDWFKVPENLRKYKPDVYNV